ncbi:MAG: hypothetical protein A3E57_07420 [Candidatus Muproteobacteria bacterium RIFCSPHIGHO2_12_FULL_60_33]|nr:MAG: hypothetical protein A3E57_07420 [Candidatus Muproteobacteria bacterium RIFCSPHIGHO2_12_FULL_60_33]OGI56075.1 MAG: hypothetical protein A3D32_08170 [Candidatus Muproteobacteria bacterium RIFCSPHIGHO2_02_FULL_60_13]
MNAALLAALARLAIIIAGLAGMMAAAAADDFAGLADPTQPAYGVAAGAGAGAGALARPAGPLLQSTFISANQRRAVIGGRSYTVGDKFGGGTITDIQPYEVVLKQAGRESRLRLLPRLAKETYMVKVPAYSQEKWHRGEPCQWHGERAHRDVRSGLDCEAGKRSNQVPSTDRRTEGGQK